LYPRTSSTGGRGEGGYGRKVGRGREGVGIGEGEGKGGRRGLCALLNFS